MYGFGMEPTVHPPVTIINGSSLACVKRLNPEAVGQFAWSLVESRAVYGGETGDHLTVVQRQRSRL